MRWTVFVLLCLVPIFLPQSACGIELEVSGLGGAVLVNDNLASYVDRTSTSSVPGQVAFGADARVRGFRYDTFVFLGYRYGDVYLDPADPDNVAAYVYSRSHYLAVGLGRDFLLGYGRVAPRIGVIHVRERIHFKSLWTSAIQRDTRDTGLTVGMHVIAPLTDTIELMFLYELAMRSSYEYSGRLSDGRRYRLIRGNQDHTLMLGVSIRPWSR